MTTQGAFDWCVQLLEWLAAKLGTTYEAVNVWVFCVIWPTVTLALILLVLYQRATIRRLWKSIHTWQSRT